MGNQERSSDIIDGWISNEIQKLADVAINNDDLNRHAFAAHSLAAGAEIAGIPAPAAADIDDQIRAAAAPLFSRQKSKSNATLKRAHQDALKKPRDLKQDARASSPPQRRQNENDSHNDEPDTARSAMAIWDATWPLAGTPAERYLAEHRAIDLGRIPPGHLVDLKFHPHCPTGRGGGGDHKMPALICRLRNVPTGAPVDAIQRIFLSADGSKAKMPGGRPGKASLGKYGANGAVCFGPIVAGEAVHLTEGIEDALSVLSECTGSAIASLSVGRLAKLELPTGVNLVVCGDSKNDKDRKQARAAAENHASALGCPVGLAFAGDVGDFNELIKTSEAGAVKAAVDGAEAIEPDLTALEFDYQIKLDTVCNALIKGLLHPGDLGVLFGPSGAGKTFLALDAAYAIARGDIWCGRATNPAPVLYINHEGLRGFRNRMLANAIEKGSAGNMLARHTVSTLLAAGSAGDAGQKEILKAATQLATVAGKPVGLIVVDTLARAMAGDDENAASDMMALVGRCAKLSMETGAAVLLVHHCGKDTDRGMRGSSALFAAADLVLSIEYQEGEPERFAGADKSKDGETGPLASFALRQIRLGIDDDGDPITTCIIDAKPAKKIRMAVKRINPRSAVGEVLMALDEAGLAGKSQTIRNAANLPPNVRVVREVDLVEACLLRGIGRSADADPARRDKSRRRSINRNIEAAVRAGALARRDYQGETVFWRPEQATGGPA